MAFAIVGNQIPSTVTVGESLSWAINDGRFPASDGWGMTYALVKSGTRITITSAADGDTHLIEVTAATTAAYAAGEYNWQLHATDGTERYKVASGVVTILPDFATQTTGLDARGHYKKVIDALEASIEGRASLTQQQQKIGEVSVVHMTLDEQVRMLQIYKELYQAEMVAAGKAKNRSLIKARFGRPV